MDSPTTPFPDPEALEHFLCRTVKSVPNFAKLVSRPKLDEPLPLPLPPRAPDVDIKTGIVPQSRSPLATMMSTDAFGSPRLNTGGYRTHGNLSIRPHPFDYEIASPTPRHGRETVLSTEEFESEVDPSNLLSVPVHDHLQRPISPKSAWLSADSSESDKENVAPCRVQKGGYDSDSDFEDERSNIQGPSAHPGLSINFVDVADEHSRGFSSEAYYSDNEDSDDESNDDTASKQRLDYHKLFKSETVAADEGFGERPMKRPRFEIYSSTTRPNGAAGDAHANHPQQNASTHPQRFSSLAGGVVPAEWCVSGLADRLSEWWAFGLEASSNRRISPRVTKPRQLDIAELVVLAEGPGKKEKTEICRFDLGNVAQIKLWECDVVGEYSDDSFITDPDTLTTRWTWFEIKEKNRSSSSSSSTSTNPPAYLRRKRAHSSANPVIDINGNTVSNELPDQPWQVLAFPSAYITRNCVEEVTRPALWTCPEQRSVGFTQHEAGFTQRTAGSRTFAHPTALRPKTAQLRAPLAGAPSARKQPLNAFGAQTLEDPFWMPRPAPAPGNGGDENATAINPLLINPYVTGSPLVKLTQPQPQPHTTTTPTPGTSGLAVQTVQTTHLLNTAHVFRARADPCRALPLLELHGIDTPATLLHRWHPVADAFAEGELLLQYLVLGATESAYASPGSGSANTGPTTPSYSERFETPGLSFCGSGSSSGVGGSVGGVGAHEGGTPLTCRVVREQPAVSGQTVLRGREVMVQLDLGSVCEGLGKTEMHAWQFAMLDRLAGGRAMPWEGWVERKRGGV